MKRTVIVLVLLVAACLAGCGRVLTGPEVLAIHDTAGLAKDMFQRIDADPYAPGYVKVWAGGNALAWNNLDARIQNKPAVDANGFIPSK